MQSNSAAQWQSVQDGVAKVREAIAEVIVGQESVVEEAMVALLCRGHCLIVGVPGLAKTLLVSTMGEILGLDFRRIQFTPDLMPMDILGSEILQESAGVRSFQFSKGPVFANLVLADEINRTPPKTQAALLECMQERQVTVSGKCYALDDPFIVFATQNPIEHEGTYPLPEAQLDRFFFQLHITYPSLAEEKRILELTTRGRRKRVKPVLTKEDILTLQSAVLEVPVPDNVTDMILKLVHSSRPESGLATEMTKKYVAWGAGPRASQNLTIGAKALAMLQGRAAASAEEVLALARPVLRHRIIPNYNATGEGVGVEQIIDHLISNA
ncbi:MAG: MoxR family ATPase [Kiritimatiellae bacterium]|nr:MoxR family ATPase [Kiritimatiellia bacterium]